MMTAFLSELCARDVQMNSVYRWSSWLLWPDISPNIIAMGFPSEKLEGYYRNNIDDVYK